MAPERSRCAWATRPLDVAYHDTEWGVPVHDDRVLFEMLTLEGAQAGLSWSTILAKRDGYRRAFAGFDVERLARFGTADAERLLADPGIVRNRLKITATIDNARATLRLREGGRTLDQVLWELAGGRPRINHWTSVRQVPASTPESDRMSRELKRLGFRFVGTTICYAFQQAVGMVNDHLTSCFRHDPVARIAGAESSRRV